MSDTQCCIVGAGPAGVLLSLLLARKGVNVTLLELHADLDRDFRGDTVHASTMEVLDQIGLSEKILDLPHAKMRSLSVKTPQREVELIRFQRLRTKFPYVAMMPQVHFLNCLVKEAKKYPNFSMQLATPVSGLIDRDDRIAGVMTKKDGVDIEITADLVVGCDGRFSRIRQMAGFQASESSPPMDVAWIRLPRIPGDPDEAGAFHVAGGRLCAVLSRTDEWQLGYIFPKGDFNDIRRDGIEALRNGISGIVPMLEDRVHLIEDFSEVHLLNVKSDCLERWYRDGLVVLGDAAHVMSPIGGVGINYAVGDAVGAANVLIPAFREGRPGLSTLAAIQSSREPVTRKIQRLQGFIQKNIVLRALKDRDFEVPLPARILLGIPGLRNIPARIIALGFERLRLNEAAL